MKVVEPYLIITSVLLLLATLICFSSIPEIDESKVEVDGVRKDVKPRVRHFSVPLADTWRIFNAFCDLM